MADCQTKWFKFEYFPHKKMNMCNYYFNNINHRLHKQLLFKSSVFPIWNWIWNDKDNVYFRQQRKSILIKVFSSQE